MFVCKLLWMVFENFSTWWMDFRSNMIKPYRVVPHPQIETILNRKWWISTPQRIVWSSIWQFKKQPKYNTFGSFFIFSTPCGSLLIPSDSFPPRHPGPLGLLGVGPKHKLLVFCSHYLGVWYPDLLALEIPTGPTSVGRFLTFMKTLSVMGLKK